VVHTYHEILFSIKNECTDAHNLDKTQENHDEWQKANSKRVYILWFYLYNILKLHFWNGEQSSVASSLGLGREVGNVLKEE